MEDPRSGPEGKPSSGGEQAADAPFSGVSDDELGALVEDVLKSGKHATHDAAPQAGARAPSAVFPEPPREGGSQAEDPATYDWFVAIESKSVGPISFEKVKKLWEDGEIGTDTPCWRNGLGDWQPLNRVESLAKALIDRPKPKPVASIPRPQRRVESGSWKPAVSHLLEEALEEKKRTPPPAAAAPQPTPAPAPAAPSAPVAPESAPADATVKVAIAPPAVTGPSNEDLERSIRQLSAQVRTLQEQLSELPEPPPKPRVLPVAALSGLLSGAVVAAALLFFKPMATPAAEDPAPAPAAPVVTKVAPPAALQPAAAAPAPAPSPTPAAPAAAPPVQPSQVVAQAPAAKPKPKPAAPAAAATTEGASAAPAPAPVKATKPAEPAKPKDDFEREFGEGGSPSDEAPKPAKAAAKPATDVSEELDESAIMATVLRHKSEVDQCTRQAKQADPDASGRVVMRWTIHPDGHTSAVSVQNEDFAGTPVAACLERLIKKWTFPKHQVQHAPVSFPFVL